MCVCAAHLVYFSLDSLYAITLHSLVTTFDPQWLSKCVRTLVLFRKTVLLDVTTQILQELHVPGEMVKEAQVKHQWAIRYKHGYSLR